MKKKNPNSSSKIRYLESSYLLLVRKLLLSWDLKRYCNWLENWYHHNIIFKSQMVENCLTHLGEGKSISPMIHHCRPYSRSCHCIHWYLKYIWGCLHTYIGTLHPCRVNPERPLYLRIRSIFIIGSGQHGKEYFHGICFLIDLKYIFYHHQCGREDILR